MILLRCIYYITPNGRMTENYELERVQKELAIYGAHPASYPMGTGGLFLEVKQPDREADHSHLVPSSIMREAMPPLPQYAFIMWCLVKHRERRK
jgi:hypothetical protein